jgi:hypothetical protein
MFVSVPSSRKIIPLFSVSTAPETLEEPQRFDKYPHRILIKKKMSLTKVTDMN